MPTLDIESGKWIEDKPSGTTDKGSPEIQDEDRRIPELQIVPVSDTERNKVEENIPPFLIDPEFIKQLIRHERARKQKRIINEA